MKHAYLKFCFNKFYYPFCLDAGGFYTEHKVCYYHIVCRLFHINYADISYNKALFLKDGATFEFLLHL